MLEEKLAEASSILRDYARLAFIPAFARKLRGLADAVDEAKRIVSRIC
jgi:hypothetical protein